MVLGLYRFNCNICKNFSIAILLRGLRCDKTVLEVCSTVSVADVRSLSKVNPHFLLFSFVSGINHERKLLLHVAPGSFLMRAFQASFFSKLTFILFCPLKIMGTYSILLIRV